MNLQYSAKTAWGAIATLSQLQLEDWAILVCQQALDVLVIPQHSGLENAQLAQLLLYAVLQVLEVESHWLRELLCLAATRRYWKLGSLA